MSIGDIDPEIQAEAEKVQGRYTELNTQQDELIKTTNNLKTIVEQLKNKIRKQFRYKLKEINKTFDHYFKILFKGGNAKLQGDIVNGDIVRHHVLGHRLG
jgi:chromosome segregation protein